MFRAREQPPELFIGVKTVLNHVYNKHIMQRMSFRLKFGILLSYVNRCLLLWFGIVSHRPQYDRAKRASVSLPLELRHVDQRESALLKVSRGFAAEEGR